MLFTPNVLNLFTSYFSNRRQYVKLGNYKTDAYDTCSGVSQGSTLGLTQFLIMNNDFPDVVEYTQCLILADNLNLYLGIKNPAHCEALQRHIDSVEAWGEHNRLKFKTSKCKMMKYTLTRSPYTYSYKLWGVPLARVTEIRGLVLTWFHVSPLIHIIIICEQSFKSLGFIIPKQAHYHLVMFLVCSQ